MLILAILGTSVAVQGAIFGSGSGSIFLDNVLCRGSESSLLDCNTNAIGQHNCDHSEDAGVRCNGNMYCIFTPCYGCRLLSPHLFVL